MAGSSEVSSEQSTICTARQTTAESSGQEEDCQEQEQEHRALENAVSPLLGCDGGGDPEAENADSDGDEEGENAAEGDCGSPTRRKKRTRRRKRHPKKTGTFSTSTGTPGSGGNSHSEDEARRRGSVVTWRDLGLGASFSSSGGKEKELGRSPKASGPPPSPASGPPALAPTLARRGLWSPGGASPMPGPPPPPPRNPPSVGKFCDASERRVPPAPLQQPDHWVSCGEVTRVPVQPRWESGAVEALAFQGEATPTMSADRFTFQLQCTSPCGILTNATLALVPSSPCSPTGCLQLAAPTCTPTAAGAAMNVPSWLHGNDTPICGEDLANKLRSVAQETYED